MGWQDKDASMCVYNYLLYNGKFHPWYWPHRNTHQTQLLHHCRYTGFAACRYQHKSIMNCISLLGVHVVEMIHSDTHLMRKCMSSDLSPVRIHMWLSKREVGREHNSYFRRSCMGMSHMPVTRRRWYRRWGSNSIRSPEAVFT